MVPVSVPLMAATVRTMRMGYATSTIRGYGGSDELTSLSRRLRVLAWNPSSGLLRLDALNGSATFSPVGTVR